MPKEHVLEMPLKEEKIRELKINDIVYLSGTIHTMRDMGHRKTVDLLEINKGDELPFDLRNGALWHCGPIVHFSKEENQWIVVSAGSTTSSRFSILGAKLIELLPIRITIGKGTMNEEAHEAMKKIGSCYLNTTGGCAALYAEQIEKVQAVYWKELGLPEAIWVLKMNNFGPLIVGIDSWGNSIFKNIKEKTEKKLNQIYLRNNLKGKYAYLPKRVPCS